MSRPPIGRAALRALLEERFPDHADAQMASRARMRLEAFVAARREMGFIRASERHFIPPEIRAEILRRCAEPDPRYSAIAREMGILRSWVDRVRREEGLLRTAPIDGRAPFTPEEIARLREMVAQGAPANAIAKRLGRSVRAVEGHIDKLDAPTPKRRACLCCGASFLSEGAHNRMCAPCRVDPMRHDPLSPNWAQMRARAERSGAGAHARRASPAISSLSSPGAAHAVSGAFSGPRMRGARG